MVNGNDSTCNAILSNSIFSNGLLGIDLFPSLPGATRGEVTPYDAGDGDIGPNNLQNYPVLTSAASGGDNIEGSLNSATNTEFHLEFFANTTCDISGNGEGETFLGSFVVLTDGTGNVSFAASLPATVAAGLFITATATDSAINTSDRCTDAVGNSSYSSVDVTIAHDQGNGQAKGRNNRAVLTFGVSLAENEAQKTCRASWISPGTPCGSESKNAKCFTVKA